jgi:uncharacterized protein YoxC
MNSKASKHTPAKKVEETDTELSELVDTFQKLQHSLPSTHGPSTPETLEYLKTEIGKLTEKQHTIQAQIDSKTNEIVTLRQTLLVVSGALQGLQHVHSFMSTSAEARVSSSLLTTTEA